MPSIEALAMAGADYLECGISLVERDRRETPQYLLAEENPKRSREVKLSSAPSRQLRAKGKPPVATSDHMYVAKG
ncbi:unnamed protein product [Linum trigynum]|uniref:Indole-3-glycerol-phosphate synthase n=1 Tax=Linum trigynum TaxID=586398 RepID=A0AAV2ESK1_9ROSI